MINDVEKKEFHYFIIAVFSLSFVRSYSSRFVSRGSSTTIVYDP